MTDGTSTPLVRTRTASWLRRGAALVAIAIVAFWAAKGAHRGWSQDRVPHQQTDEVTGLQFVTYEERYVPGLEVLASGLAASAALFATSFLFRNKTQNHE